MSGARMALDCGKADFDVVVVTVLRHEATLPAIIHVLAETLPELVNCDIEASKHPERQHFLYQHMAIRHEPHRTVTLA
jgi:hypothetical protein